MGEPVQSCDDEAGSNSAPIRGWAKPATAAGTGSTAPGELGATAIAGR
jgi:hypothetical protein